MNKQGSQHHSYLFTIRLWVEEVGDDRCEWRGKVQHAISGDTSYFRDWSTLVAFLMATLPSLDTDGS